MPTDLASLFTQVDAVITEFPVIVIPIVLILTGAVIGMVARLSKKAGR